MLYNKQSGPFWHTVRYDMRKDSAIAEAGRWLAEMVDGDLKGLRPEAELNIETALEFDPSAAPLLRVRATLTALWAA